MRLFIALSVIVCAIAFTVTATPQQAVLAFKDIKLILDRRCVPCHGDSYPGGNLRLNSYESLIKGGKNGKAVLPKNSAGSRLIKMIKGTVQPRMPMDAQPLTRSEIELISKWITQGAKK